MANIEVQVSTPKYDGYGTVIDCPIRRRITMEWNKFDEFVKSYENHSKDLYLDTSNPLVPKIFYKPTGLTVFKITYEHIREEE